MTNERKRFCDVCGDNRFELIEKYKQELIKNTNIETSPDEMKVIDSIFFRAWQMGWLDNNDKQIPKKIRKERYLSAFGGFTLMVCPICLKSFGHISVAEEDEYCSNCGQKLDWRNENGCN